MLESGELLAFASLSSWRLALPARPAPLTALPPLSVLFEARCRCTSECLDNLPDYLPAAAARCCFVHVVVALVSHARMKNCATNLGGNVVYGAGGVVLSENDCGGGVGGSDESFIERLFSVWLLMSSSPVVAGWLGSVSSRKRPGKGGTACP